MALGWYKFVGVMLIAMILVAVVNLFPYEKMPLTES